MFNFSVAKKKQILGLRNKLLNSLNIIYFTTINYIQLCCRCKNSLVLYSQTQFLCLNRLLKISVPSQVAGPCQATPMKISWLHHDILHVFCLWLWVNRTKICSGTSVALGNKTFNCYRLRNRDWNMK